MAIDPNDFIITRKRKKYKFAVFANLENCFEFEEWDKTWQPQTLEVGAGSGLFSTSMAQALGEKYLAVDVKADRLQQGAQLALEQQVSNIRFLRSRVDQLPELISPASLQKIWVTFPDPFPKKRAAKHRLTHPRYLSLYQNMLAKTGALYFKTDSRELFDYSLEQLVDQQWSIEELSFDLHESRLNEAYKTRTSYEERFMKEGIAINFVKARPPAILDS